MNIRQVGTELLCEDRRTDGQTDRKGEANIRYTQFCKRTYKLCCDKKSASVDMSIGVSRETDSFVCLSVHLSVCPSVCLSVTTRLALEEYS